ncbi:glycoside hydrolase family 20 protein [Tenuifilum sp.]|uniref:glycoside hydrolase family 20 protein n=1 Tax=Tenuifilum sp. TaxID=2760880 RepID=UPI002CC49795|nr:family 20 glycosylhydrolase [Tenuifilum sp.]HOK86663.1 family 20 glycosylhydrolase [Tenuifilum sp.]HPP90498.1 family 20 glycosylhydrolase [Tenuifilum sp.]
MRKLVMLTLALTALLSCSRNSDVNIIPKPVSIKQVDGDFTINSKTLVRADSADSIAFNNAIYLVELLNQKGVGCAFNAEVGVDSTNSIVFTRTGCPDSLGAEGYMLSIGPKHIVIKANESAGFFYAIQTLRQLMPANFEKNDFRQKSVTVPCLSIIDKPRFPWRGLNLDCCRHFMTKDFVKRYIDLLAYHKMNVLHWHLTEDQGWRIEIKKYPRLTEIGAWRTNADGTVYGGFYTQDDIREVVSYAAKRHVMVVPEIEMPGHSVAALAAYPNLSCTGEPLKVETNWGVFKDIYCAGNDSTFIFLQDVLTEVVELFPSPYIHIGGDEAPKYRWENCPKCKARLKSEGLSNYEELQRYFISQIAKFLEGKGKTIIGWDEILEGGRPHNATVQAWRGIDRATKALSANAPVIVSPTSHCYFDYPVEVTNLQKVYSFDPVPAQVDSAKIQLVLGGECNMWTEYAPQETVDSKVFPRILAIAEVLWTYPRERNYNEFLNRVRNHYHRLEALGVTYGFEQSAVEFKSSIGDDKKSIFVELIKGQDNLTIRYTTNGDEPTVNSTRYCKPIELTSSTTLRAAAFNNGNRVGDVFERSFVVSKSLGKPIELGFVPAEKYLGGSKQALVDGRLGTPKYNDGIWQAVQGHDMVATIDLGANQPIKNFSVGFLQNILSWIFLPNRVDVFVSADSISFEQIAQMDCPENIKRQPVLVYRFNAFVVNNIMARYVRFVAHNPGPCPEWHPASGSPTWLFADEIVVE